MSPYNRVLNDKTPCGAASPNAKIFASHIKLQHNAMQLKSEFESMFQEIKKATADKVYIFM